MTSAYYIWPGQVYFGFGAAQRAGQIARDDGATNVFVLADPGVVSAGLIAPITASLHAAELAHSLYSEVVPNPSTSSIDAAVAAFRASEADLIIAVGGGSALDTAKALRIVAGGPPEARAAEYSGRRGSQARPDPKHLSTLVAVPTTAGTGAEVTAWAVVTDEADKIKSGIGGARGMPSVALIDPELMLTLPPFLTAATGMDALTHCIEAYVSTKQAPPLDPMTLYGIELIARNLPIAVAQGANRNARYEMAQAAYIGGVAISSKWTGACHALAHQLSGFANVQHGLANAIMLPHQMAYSLPGAIERYARIAEALGVPARGSLRQRAERGVEAVRQLAQDVGLPTRLRDAGVSEDVIAPMAKAAYTIDVNWQTNPRAVSEAVMEQLYRAAW